MFWSALYPDNSCKTTFANPDNRFSISASEIEKKTQRSEKQIQAAGGEVSRQVQLDISSHIISVREGTVTGFGVQPAVCMV